MWESREAIVSVGDSLWDVCFPCELNCSHDGVRPVAISDGGYRFGFITSECVGQFGKEEGDTSLAEITDHVFGAKTQNATYKREDRVKIGIGGNRVKMTGR